MAPTTSGTLATPMTAAARPAENPTRFGVPDGAEPDALLAVLDDRQALEREPVQSVRRTVLDTFDWRIHAEGWILERERVGRRSELVLRAIDGDELVRLGGSAVPVFARDLPEGPLRSRLAPVLEMRALTPVAELATHRWVARLVDGEGKTRVRVRVEQNQLVGRARTSKVATPGNDLGSVVTVLPLRGYETDAERVRELLAAQVAVEGGAAEGDAPDPVVAALAALGQAPGWYSSKLKVELDPGLPAAEAYRRILRRLRQTMRDNEAGTLADVDSEFLHDYRVAVRRTRSVLGQAKGVLPADLLAWAIPEWRWLGGVTGPTRDLDVWLLTLPELEVAVPDLLEGGLARLDAHVAGLQRDAHDTLVAELASPHALDVLARWDAWLDAADEPPGPEVGASAAAEPIVGIARARIWKAYRRVRDDGRAIGPASPGPELHELRKDAKKLRYLLECFATLFPADDMKSIVRELKLVQDVLGTFQDCEVQTGTLVGFGEGVLAAAPRGDRAGTARTLMAMGSLVELIEERRLEARAAFAARFERFDSPDNRARYRELFKDAS